MSSYSHTIGFKVLIDSEVIDFTFRVPRGTLLIQIMDELETTLRIQPKIIAIINHNGEVINIENLYSPIDYLIQKFGTEFYAGESSFITFNHGEYIIDLEVPEAIPFAATYRTACKSFSLNIPDVGIERQDGQIMDFEVFSMPTAFVLNSWGNFYRIVGKEKGDVFLEPIGIPEKKISATVEPAEKIGTMVYPPKLDDTDIIEVAKKLVEATPLEDSEPDKMTQNFVDASFPVTEEQPQEPEVFLTQPISEEESLEEEPSERYPWERDDEKEEFDRQDIGLKISSEPPDPSATLESLMSEIIIDDEIEEESLGDAEADLTDEEFAEIQEALTPIDEPLEELPEEAPEDKGLIIEPSVVDEVFQGILAEEEKETFIRKGPIEEPETEDDYDSFDIDEDLEEEEDEDDLGFYDDEDEEEETEDIDDFDEIDETEIIDTIELPIVEEQEEVISEQNIDELPTVITDEISFDDSIVELTDDEPIIEPPIDIPAKPLASELPLNERLALRNKELAELKESLIEDKKNGLPAIERWISLDYYERMYPQKIYPLTIKIPPSEHPETVDKDLEEVKIRPILPGCYITPQEEVIDLTDKNMTTVEFNVTPLVRRGKLTGKIGLIHDHKGMLSIKINSRVVNPFWPRFTALLAVLLGGLPLILDPLVDLNTRLATAINNLVSAKVIMGIEFGIIGVFLAITFGLIFGLKPKKCSIKKKFFSNNNQNGK